MTQPAKVQEPSMEEILASIRRIIADDEAKPGADVGAEASRSAAMKSDIAKPELAKTEPPKPQVVASRSPSPVKPPAAAPKPVPAKADALPASGNSQDDIDAMLAGLEDVAPAKPKPVVETDVFELTDDMALPDPAPKPFRKVDPQDDLEFSENARFRQPAFDAPPASGHAPAPNILSRSTVSAVESAFSSLANTVLSNNARTLEDLVKEMLRPMLKTWLDDNLPGVVERIVKAEIERVSRGR